MLELDDREFRIILDALRRERNRITYHMETAKRDHLARIASGDDVDSDPIFELISESVASIFRYDELIIKFEIEAEPHAQPPEPGGGRRPPCLR